jgi:hypothetical protein
MINAPPGPRPERCAPIADAFNRSRLLLPARRRVPRHAGVPPRGAFPARHQSTPERRPGRAPRTPHKPGSGPGGDGSASPPKLCRQCGDPSRGLPRFESPAEPDGCPPVPGHLRRPAPAETGAGVLLHRGARGPIRVVDPDRSRRGPSACRSWRIRCIGASRRAHTEVCSVACGPAANVCLESYRPRPVRLGVDADRLQGVAPPTSP